MSKQLVIPTIFTASEQVSGVVSKVQSSISSLASTAKLAGGVLAGAFAYDMGKQILDYQTAVQSFRTIVSDLSDTDFAKFTNEIKNVADATSASSTDVAKSFETIAGLNAEFAKTATGLGQVSQAAITLSKASRMELQPATEAMVGIMNQFGLSAEQADRTINVLAAGQAVGAASIANTAEAMNNFGAVAKGANITIEQSVALIQTMAKFGQMGADAGSRLRSAIINLQNAGVGYSSGAFKINDALAEMKGQLDKLATAKEKDEFLTAKFGKEGITAGKILLDNVGVYTDFTKAVTGTSEAQKAADINSSTLAESFTRLKNRMVTMITTSDGASLGLRVLGGIVDFLANNLGLLTTLVVAGGLAWFAYNAQVWYNVASTTALEFISGVMAVTQGVLNGEVLASKAGMFGAMIATHGLTAALWLATAAQTALNFVMNLNPIGLIITAIGALIAIFVLSSDRIKGWGLLWENMLLIAKGAWDIFTGAIELKLQGISYGFHAMLNSVITAWLWAQNKVGLITDKQYEDQKAKMAEGQAQRASAMNNTVAKIAGGALGVQVGAKGALNSLSVRTDEEMNALPVTPATQATTTNNYNSKPQPVELNIKAPKGYTVESNVNGGVSFNNYGTY
jgi:TP901 family phage tail tape measure protein